MQDHTWWFEHIKAYGGSKYLKDSDELQIYVIQNKNSDKPQNKFSIFSK